MESPAIWTVWATSLSTANIMPESLPWYVYCLCESCGVVRYIGVTKNPVDRFQRHLRESRYPKTRKHYWLSSLVRRGEFFRMEILERTSDWNEAERRWIARYRANGNDLVNGNNGGLDLSHVRGKSEAHPEIKRYYRVLESATRGKYITQDVRERIKRLLDLYRQLVREHRKNGTLGTLEARIRLVRGND